MIWYTYGYPLSYTDYFTSFIVVLEVFECSCRAAA